MTIHVNQLMEVVADVCEIEGVKVTVKESLKGGLVAGVLTAVGGLLGGKTGMLLGAAVGGLTAYAVTDEFRSVSDVIRNDLSNQEKLTLKNKIVNAFEDFHIHDIQNLLLLIQSNHVAKKMLIDAVVSFVQKAIENRKT